MRTRKTRSQLSSSGFSLIEVLVASFFLLVIMLGVMPIFTRALVTNQMAYDNTRAAAFARSEIENYMQAPFDDPTGTPVMNLPAGESALEVEQYLDPETHVWTTGPAPAGTSYVWSRKTTVRQFNISAIDNGVLDDSEALQGNADPSNVHLKQVLIEIRRGNDSSVLGPPRTITLNTFRSN